MTEVNSKEKAKEVFDRALAGITDQDERLIAYSLVVAREAASQEAHTPESAGKTWVKVDQILNQIVEKNPQKAFAYGLDLSSLAKVSDSQTEFYRGWLRGIGITLLVHDDLLEKTKNHLNSESGGELGNALEGFMKTDTKDWKIEALTESHFFNLVISLYLATKLGEGDGDTRASKLFDMAVERLKDKNIQKQLTDWYRASEVDYLYQALMSHFS